MLGRSDTDGAAMLIEHFGLNETPEGYMDRQQNALLDGLRQCKAMPGAVELVSFFKERGVPVGVATSACRMQHEVKESVWPSLFSGMKATVTVDDVSRAKPDPEPYLKAMSGLGVTEAAACLVFEDAPAGVKSANRAGMPVVFVPNARLPVESALSEAKARPTWIVGSLCEVDKGLFTFAAPGQPAR
jgi:pseudouridine-5'-monophosphatase